MPQSVRRSERKPFLTTAKRPGVLYVIQAAEPSGAEVIHMFLMRTDRDALLACPPGSATARLAEASRVGTVALPFRALRHSGGALETLRSLLRGMASARDLRRILRANPDRRIVYCIALRPGMLAAVSGIGLGRRVAWYVSDFPPPAPIGTLTRVLARLACDAPIATSRCVGDRFAGRSKRLRERLRVVYPGVPVERFTLSPRPGAPHAGLLGHVSPTKRTDLGVEVARRVAAQVPEFRLDVIGRAQYRPEDFALERKLKASVAADRTLARVVRFRGYATDVPATLAELGLLLHCRPDEPFGVALVEAMAAGLPVVAPNAAGPAEIVEHGVTGFLYPPEDAEAAAAQIVRLIREPGLAADVATAGRAAVERRFTTDRQVVELEAILADLSDTA
jgi:glycosyltransferase involved in cell wall biosynthesis